MKRMRRNIPFEGLAIEFGIGKGTAEDYYYEMLDLFHENLVPRLLDPPDADTLDGWIDPIVKEKLPGAKFIVDLTSFRLKSKENATVSRILYSAYHHQSEAAAVFGMMPHYEYCLNSSSLTQIMPLQLLQEMECFYIGLNSLEAYLQRLQQFLIRAI